MATGGCISNWSTKQIGEMYVFEEKSYAQLSMRLGRYSLKVRVSLNQWRLVSTLPNGFLSALVLLQLFLIEKIKNKRKLFVKIQTKRQRKSLSLSEDNGYLQKEGELYKQQISKLHTTGFDQGLIWSSSGMFKNYRYIDFEELSERNWRKSKRELKRSV